VRRRRILVAVAFTAIALVAFGAGAAVVVARKEKREPPSAAQTLTVDCRSAALGGELPAIVYLPAGYRHSSDRYRVIYFLHGLPASPDSFKSYAFVASALSSRQRTIVVAPQGARNDGDDREYLDWSPSEDWPQAISHDLPHCIDHRFRTVANRFGRALIGLSAGGYGAFNIGLRHLDTFAAVESWSGYFEATDPTGTRVLDLGSDEANTAARVPHSDDLKTEAATWPSLIGFYVGNQDLRFLNVNQEFDADLRQAGVGHTFEIYPGGHSRSLWQTQAPRWLSMAVSYMAGEAKRRGR
jgi:enterochelin esterase-like enzyme